MKIFSKSESLLLSFSDRGGQIWYPFNPYCDRIPDPKGKQGLKHPLHALLGLMLLAMLSGRKGMMAAGQQGRGLTAR